MGKYKNHNMYDIDFVVEHYTRNPDEVFRPHAGGLKSVFDQLVRAGIMERVKFGDGTYYRLTNE